MSVHNYTKNIPMSVHNYTKNILMIVSVWCWYKR